MRHYSGKIYIKLISSGKKLKNSKFEYSQAPYKNNAGFTLLELLIVVTILAVLSVAIIVVINPAETIKKARDTQRISDLSSIKTAIVLYQTSVTTPYLGGASADTICQTAANTYSSSARIAYSNPSDQSGQGITDAALDNYSANATYRQATIANLGLTTASGWITVNLDNISTGSPISNFPVDPTNDVTATGTGGGTQSAIGAVNANALVYRYVCAVISGNKTFEINATLESTAYTSATSSENKTQRDGGNSTIMYETGTRLDLLGVNTDGTGDAGF